MSFKIDKVHDIKAENDDLMIDATVTENLIERRVRFFYDPTTLLITDIQELPTVYGNYYFLSDGTYLNYGFRDITKYNNDQTIEWHKDFTDFFLRDVISDDSGNLYLAGNDYFPETVYDAVIMKLDGNGVFLSNNIETLVSPPEWYTNKLSFYKLINFEDKIVAIGSNNYNADSWTGNHSLMIIVYDTELNKVDETGITLQGSRGSTIRQCKLSNESFYCTGVANQAEYGSEYLFKVEKLQMISNVTYADNNFRIYPNPSIDKVFFDLPSPGSISLYNINGVLLQSYNNPVELDISHLSSGVYLLRYTSDSGSLTHRLVKP